MTGRYVPVPVWNNRVGQWEPVDFRHGQHVRVVLSSEEGIGKPQARN